ncbi:MAG: hypothetical protein FJX78_05040 [Armatimonadetes bacterium]|nr:hypothetical protein [Armatimonadota bacterium]
MFPAATLAPFGAEIFDLAVVVAPTIDRRLAALEVAHQDAMASADLEMASFCAAVIEQSRLVLYALVQKAEASSARS